MTNAYFDLKRCKPSQLHFIKMTNLYYDLMLTGHNFTFGVMHDFKTQRQIKTPWLHILLASITEDDPNWHFVTLLSERGHILDLNNNKIMATETWRGHNFTLALCTVLKHNVKWKIKAPWLHFLLASITQVDPNWHFGTLLSDPHIWPEHTHKNGHRQFKRP